MRFHKNPAKIQSLEFRCGIGIFQEGFSGSSIVRGSLRVEDRQEKELGDLPEFLLMEIKTAWWSHMDSIL